MQKTNPNPNLTYWKQRTKLIKQNIKNTGLDYFAKRQGGSLPCICILAGKTPVCNYQSSPLTILHWQRSRVGLIYMLNCHNSTIGLHIVFEVLWYIKTSINEHIVKLATIHYSYCPYVTLSLVNPACKDHAKSTWDGDGSLSQTNSPLICIQHTESIHFYPLWTQKSSSLLHRLRKNQMWSAVWRKWGHAI